MEGLGFRVQGLITRCLRFLDGHIGVLSVFY